jgi:hypothetical protein
MARKLLCLVALISLVLLVQAVPGLADTYTLIGGKGYLNQDGGQISDWTEARGDTLFDAEGNPFVINNGYPGCANGDFHASFTDEATGQSWMISSGINSAMGTFGTPFEDANKNLWVTVTIVYDIGLDKFIAQNYGGPDISSSDTVITTIATYRADPVTGRPLLDNGFMLQGSKMSMKGAGTNSDDTPFTFTADLIETYPDHNHYGYADNFQLTYPTATPTPIPGAVWLLGTGLLGLACVGRRRRS